MAAVLWSGCGSSSSEAPAPAHSAEEDEAVLRDPVLDAVVNPNARRAPRHAVPADRRQEHAAQQPATSGVGVRGITGSLTAFEVDEAMSQRSDALMACVQQRPGRLGHVAGDIQFHLSVDARGKVESAHVMESDIGYEPLEQCLTAVVAATPFPAPAGAERAEATWRMSVDPLGRAAELLEEQSLLEALERNAAATYEACQVAHDQRYVVTAYVNSAGQMQPVTLRAAWRGPNRTRQDPPEQIACLAQAIGEWKRVPKPRARGKARFELRWMPAPEPARSKGKAKKKRRR